MSLVVMFNPKIQKNKLKWQDTQAPKQKFVENLVNQF